MKAVFFLSIALLASPLLAVDTTIKGGRMELVNQGESVLFTNGVRLDHGTDQLKSERMRTNKTRDKVDAAGNVRLFRQVSSTETWNGFGESGFYDTKAGSGYLMGSKNDPAHLIRTEILTSTSSRVMHLYAHRIEFYREPQRTIATGQVRGSTMDPQTLDQSEFWSDQADFDGAAKAVTLTGAVQPRVRQQNGLNEKTVTGDKIVYSTESQRFLSDGHAQAVFVDANERKPK
jgi:lipopolysaccharide export system protein LptA